MAGWPPGHCQVGADSRVILAGRRSIPECGKMACGGTPRRPPLRPSKPLLPRPSPRTTHGFSLPHPARHVQAALCRALHLAASRSGGLPRRAGRVQRCARGGRQRGALGLQRVCSRGARAKSRPVEFCRGPWRMPLARRFSPLQTPGQPLPQALPQLPQLRCVHLHNTRRLAASAGCARRPLLGAGELGRPRSGAQGRQGGWARAVARPFRAAPSALAARPAPDRLARRGGGASGHALARPAPGGQRGAGERPQAWAPAGAELAGVGGRGRVGLRERMALFFLYPPLAGEFVDA